MWNPCFLIPKGVRTMSIEAQLESYKAAVKEVLKNFDFTVLPSEISIRNQLIAHRNISLVLDVGANTGQYASLLRGQGYQGRILSFEPLAAEFEQLKQNAAEDPQWDCKQLALGSYNGSCEINRAGNSYSSSILPMLERHIINAPDSHYVGKELISIARLDSLEGEIANPHDRVYLKIDTQGYEMEVLKGAVRFLDRVSVLELELSVVPLYERQVLYQQMIQHLDLLDFDLVWVEKGFSELDSGEILQFDGIFLKRA